MKHLIFLLAVLSLNSCATASRCSAWSPNYDTLACDKDASSSNYHPLARNPQDVSHYLAAHVDAKKLKDWDKHVSDDTTVIQFNADTGEGSAR